MTDNTAETENVSFFQFNMKEWLLIGIIVLTNIHPLFIQAFGLKAGGVDLREQSEQRRQAEAADKTLQEK